MKDKKYEKAWKRRYMPMVLAVAHCSKLAVYTAHEHAVTVGEAFGVHADCAVAVVEGLTTARSQLQRVELALCGQDLEQAEQALLAASAAVADVAELLQHIRCVQVGRGNKKK